jgi:hypothetical protein
VDRLHALKLLHDQSAQFGATLGHLDQVQQQTAQSIATQGATMTAVRFDASLFSLC